MVAIFYIVPSYVSDYCNQLYQLDPLLDSNKVYYINLHRHGTYMALRINTCHIKIQTNVPCHVEKSSKFPKVRTDRRTGEQADGFWCTISIFFQMGVFQIMTDVYKSCKPLTTLLESVFFPSRTISLVNKNRSFMMTTSHCIQKCFV